MLRPKAVLLSLPGRLLGYSSVPIILKDVLRGCIAKALSPVVIKSSYER